MLIDPAGDGGVCKQPVLGCGEGREELLRGADGFLHPSNVVLLRGCIPLV